MNKHFFRPFSSTRQQKLGPNQGIIRHYHRTISSKVEISMFVSNCPKELIVIPCMPKDTLPHGCRRCWLGLVLSRLKCTVLGTKKVIFLTKHCYKGSLHKRVNWWHLEAQIKAVFVRYPPSNRFSFIIVVELRHGKEGVKIDKWSKNFNFVVCKYLLSTVYNLYLIII